MTTSDRHLGDKQVIEAYLDAVGSLRVADVAPLFHEDGRVLLPYAPLGIPQEVAGRPAIGDYYEALPQMIGALNFSDYRIQATETPGEYVAEYTSDASMRATGTSYRNTYITKVTVAEGQIAELTEFFDPIRLVEAMGGTVVPPETPEIEEEVHD
ncbi:nuclear transport factor 2 family protein [Nocardioides houyundeii]|uniref:nuclear transport factor 2 family protein n=1 Tax=Nocardioides houyundeii TaxID=2045452 RepID=UPI001315392A|nr:nuclear transport factor 2 family protein [Nocardioides houyundeii]